MKKILLTLLSIIIMTTIFIGSTKATNLTTATENLTPLTQTSEYSTIVDNQKDYSNKFIFEETYEQTNPSFICDGNMYIMAKNIKISGTVNGSIYTIGENIDLANLHVNGSIFTIGKEINMSNTVVHNFYATGLNVKMNKNISILANLYTGSQTIFIDETTKVARDKYISSNNDDKVPQQLKIANYHFYKFEKMKEPTLTEKIAKITSQLITIALTVTILSIIILNLNKETKTKLQNITSPSKIVVKAVEALGFLIAVPIIAIALLLTEIFAKLSLILILIYILVILLSQTYTFIWISSLIAKKAKKGKVFIVLMTILISIIFTLLQIISYGIISILITLIGMGLILNLIFTKNKKIEKNPQPIEEKFIENPVEEQTKKEENK